MFNLLTEKFRENDENLLELGALKISDSDPRVNSENGEVGPQILASPFWENGMNYSGYPMISHDILMYIVHPFWEDKLDIV